jgi:hypothetical protein
MLLFIASLLNKKTSLYLPSGTVQSKIKKRGFTNNLATHCDSE